MNVIFFGPPGSGKGTQAKRWREKNPKSFHISTGDLLRKAIQEETPLGKEAQSYLQSGKLVPDETMLQLIRTHLQQLNPREGFILDGFPRTHMQALHLDEILQELDLKLDGFFEFRIDLKVLASRLSGRRICPKGHGEWHIENLLPKKGLLCDVCQTPLVQREDDSESKVLTRMNIYSETLSEILQYYREKGLLQTIEADALPEEVFKNLCSYVEKHKKNSPSA